MMVLWILPLQIILWWQTIILRYATFTSYVRYVLVNDDKVTWDDIIHGMLSSKFDANIPHSQIYTELVFKEVAKWPLLGSFIYTL